MTTAPAPRRRRRRTAKSLTLLLAAAASLLAAIPCAAPASVAARFVRVENPTGHVMEWQEVEVVSGGVNVVLKRGDAFAGTVVPGHDVKAREGVAMTDGQRDVRQRGPAFQASVDPVTRAPQIGPWFEIDLGEQMPIDRVVLHGSRVGTGRLFLDKGHRLVSLLGEDRRVAWAAKWDYYDAKAFPDGVFAFDVAPVTNPVVGTIVPPGSGNWVSMAWLLGAAEERLPADADARARRFAERNAPASLERLAHQFFPLLADDVPELADARRLHAAGRHAEALDAWKRYWFVKMRRANLHLALRDGFHTYAAHGDDLLNGVAVTIGDTSATAIRFTPGRIHWIDLPDKSDARALANALTDCEQKAQVGRVNRPLLDAYRRRPDPRYLARWAEVLDDWSLNFFADAARTPYEVEMLFTFNPGNHWATMMEDLSDAAVEHPELIDRLPASTLARAQLACLEKYSTAWWRQARETVFNHNTGGLVTWDHLLPYVDEFHPGRRAAREWRQAFERWMTLGTEPDGSMTEIGDDGHVTMPMQLGVTLGRLEQMNPKPAWYTPGWRNRAMTWLDNNYEYLLRHMSPGGYEHRFAVAYRPERWLSQTKPYASGRAYDRYQLDRGDAFYATPEVRRILGALGDLSVAPPAVASDPAFKPIADARTKTRADIAALLGNEKPPPPAINSDWMPYTGAYYFRGGWSADDPFLAMMACGSHGGSQPTQWPYGMFYFYDYNTPLLRAQPLQVDGLPPNQLFGRRTYEPGTKTIALTNAQEKPLPHRWHSSPRFDFGEAVFQGSYQRLPGFRGAYDHTLEQLPPGKAVENVRTVRQIVQLRGSRLFVVTDAVRTPAGTGEHQFAVPFKLSLTTRAKPGKPSTPEQLAIDEPAKRLRVDNPDGPSVTLHQFSPSPVKYRKGKEAVVDFKTYAPRLTGNVGVAEQEVFAEVKAAEAMLVSLIASRDKSAPDPIASVESMNRGTTVAGFHAKLQSGGAVWYQAAFASGERLDCGPVEANGAGLLVVSGPKVGDVSGIALGCKSLLIDGKPVPIAQSDFEFSTAGGFKAAAIFTPIDPVSFRPNVDTFTDALDVELASATPNVEIRYTTDGTPPTRASTRYAGPVRITETTEFAARAYRLGIDGKPLPADEFEVNGTKFTEPTFGFFRKATPLPPVDVAERDLQPGLNYDYLQAPWHRLYASAHWLPAAGGGVAGREMDLTHVRSDDHHGARFTGYLRVPRDGVYTFHAPRELVYMDNAPGYDLRLYVDGREWDLVQWWHAHGTWSVPLRAGLHAFQVDYADARTNPWRKSGIWRYYPRPWVIREGPPSDILLSGPGIDAPARIPKEWLFRKPVARTFPDERVLVESLAGLGCSPEGDVDVPLAALDEVHFAAGHATARAFAGLSFVAADGGRVAFADAPRDARTDHSAPGVRLKLGGRFVRLAGRLDVRVGERAVVTSNNGGRQ